MISKIRKFSHPFSAGLATGTTAHLVGGLLVYSGDQIAHFLGHVFAVIALRLLH